MLIFSCSYHDHKKVIHEKPLNFLLPFKVMKYNTYANNRLSIIKNAFPVITMPHCWYHKNQLFSDSKNKPQSNIFKYITIALKNRYLVLQISTKMMWNSCNVELTVKLTLAMDGPLVNSTSTISLFPAHAARCNGLDPLSSALLHDAS